MDYLSIPLRTRAARRSKDPANFAQYPAAVGGIWTREGDGPRFGKAGGQTLAWIESGEIGRFVGASHTLLPRFQHKGWYVDEHCHETTMGVVYRLPHGRFLSGASDPWQCDKRGEGPWLMAPDVYDCTDEAARAADRIAELYAERLREDSERENAKQQKLDTIEETSSEVDSLRGEMLEILQGIRDSKLSPQLCNRLRAEFTRMRETVRRKCREIRALEAELAQAS